MSLLVSYTCRQLVQRKTATLMTVAGIALVVFVFVCTLMLANGIEQTLAETGLPNNVIVIRNGADNEIQSGVRIDQANIILAMPEVARLEDGAPFATTDTVVVVSLRRKKDNERSNVTVRGSTAQGLPLRPQVSVIEGRTPRPGTNEVMVGRAVRERFHGTDLGASIRLVGTDWPVVGVFDAGTTAFASEIWGDYDVLRMAFRREVPSSVTFRLAEGASLDAFLERMRTDPRLNLSADRETEFYADKSRSLATFIRVLGTVVSIVFSFGAVLGAMITMYAAVANRIREIGILRALGFPRRSLFFAFGLESMLVALLGGAVGITCALLMSFVSVSTTNFQTFSEIAFNFRPSPAIVLKGVLFALVIGTVGGLLPAYRAARMKVLEAVRQA